MPTPGLPTRITFSPRSRNASEASSSTFPLGTLGWKDQSKSARVFTNGKLAMRMRLSSSSLPLADSWASVISSSAPTRSLSPSPTSLT